MRIAPVEGTPFELSYDVLVMAAGSVARTLPIPGLADHGIGFKTVGEAIYLRNHVLDRLDAASSTDDPEVRTRALTFTFVGGGYAGIEAFAELEDMARYAIEHYYPRLSPADMRWVLVEATGRILPEVDLDMGAWTVQPAHRARTWTSGSTPGWSRCPTAASSGSATARSSPARPSSGPPGRSPTRCSPRPTCRSTNAAGSSARPRCRCAGCPTPGRPATSPASPTSPRTSPARPPRPTRSTPSARPSSSPTTSSPSSAASEPTPYRHKYVGSVASLGLHKGVAQVYGVKLKGWPAWFMHRTYHVSRVPTFNRKARVVADWTLASLFRREVVSLGQLQDPRREFVFAANTGRAGQLPPPRAEESSALPRTGTGSA